MTTPYNPSKRLIADTQGRQYVLPGPFDSIDEIKRGNVRFGQHWFDQESMRLFGCRVSNQLIEGRIFISSERYAVTLPGFSESRMYTIRIASDEGEVGDLSEFQQFHSAAQAKAAALRMVR